MRTEPEDASGATSAGGRGATKRGAVSPADAAGVSGAWALLLLAVWGPFLWRLSAVWSASVEQAYGWAVPVFAVYFAMERSRWAPAPRPLSRTGRGVAWMTLGLGLVSLPLLWTVLEANAGWPAAQWASLGAVAAVTLAVAALEGGAARAAHFAFPVLFVGTALLWPAVVTARWTAVLARANAELAASVVSALGYPAVVAGQVIEVATGFVGIDEACSGLRSLQSAAMAGLFFGELFSMSGRRRLALVMAAAVAAVVGNWMRTTALTWLAAARSVAESARWHDRVGVGELIGVLVAVAALAWWIGGRNARRPEAKAGRSVRRSASVWVAIGGGALAAAVPVAWYRAHEATAMGTPVRWSLVAPEAAWKTIEVPERARRLLQASATTGLVREERKGTRAFALLVTWEGDAATAEIGASHDPSICLPASGLKMEPSARPARVRVGGVEVELAVGRFAAGEGMHHVFFCHWDARLGQVRGEAWDGEADLWRWRLSRVWEGRRRADLAYVAWVVPRENEDEARTWVEEWAPRMLRRR